MRHSTGQASQRILSSAGVGSVSMNKLTGPVTLSDGYIGVTHVNAVQAVSITFGSDRRGISFVYE